MHQLQLGTERRQADAELASRRVARFTSRLCAARASVCYLRGLALAAVWRSVPFSKGRVSLLQSTLVRRYTSKSVGALGTPHCETTEYMLGD